MMKLGKGGRSKCGVIHLDGMNGWIKQMWLYDGEEGVDVGGWRGESGCGLMDGWLNGLQL
jgi:hypothetical protein